MPALSSVAKLRALAILQRCHIHVWVLVPCLLCMLLGLQHLNTSTRVCTPFLFQHAFAVLRYANRLRQQDRSCPEAMG